MSSVSDVSAGELSGEVLPFVTGILLVTLFCAFFPGPVLWLPNIMIGSVLVRFIPVMSFGWFDEIIELRGSVDPIPH